MKKSRLILGATVLAIAGIVAGRASTKFAAPTVLYITNGAGGCEQIASAITATANQLTTNTSNGVAAFLSTSGNTYRLHNGINGSGACITPLNLR